MNELLKRLDMISSAIEINEQEIIELQITKLKGKALESEVRDILDSLEKLDYDIALSMINNYLQKFSSLTLYQDPKVQALKLKLKALEERFTELSEKKDEYLKEINEFNILYYNRLGNIISEILNLKQEILKKGLGEKERAFKREKRVFESLKEELNSIKAEIEEVEKKLNSVDEFDDEYDKIYQELQSIKAKYAKKEEELNIQRQKAKEAKKSFSEDKNKSQYDRVKEEFEEFESEYSTIKDEMKSRFELNEDELKELKNLYRKASRLCHPDLVVDELKAQAITIMQELNEAYEKRDLKKVKNIWQNLQSGLAFDMVSESIDDKEILEVKIADIKVKIDEILAEIKTIENDETFVLIQSVDNIDSYLTEVAEDLDREKEKLQQ